MSTSPLAPVKVVFTLTRAQRLCNPISTLLLFLFELTLLLIPLGMIIGLPFAILNSQLLIPLGWIALCTVALWFVWHFVLRMPFLGVIRFVLRGAGTIDTVVIEKDFIRYGIGEIRHDRYKLPRQECTVRRGYSDVYIVTRKGTSDPTLVIPSDAIALTTLTMLIAADSSFFCE
jgi:hypothetical protein